MMGGIMRPMTKIEAREVWSRRFLRLLARLSFGRRDTASVGGAAHLPSPLREEHARNNAARSQSFCPTLTRGGRG